MSRGLGGVGPGSQPLGPPLGSKRSAAKHAAEVKHAEAKVQAFSPIENDGRTSMGPGLGSPDSDALLRGHQRRAAQRVRPMRLRGSGPCVVLQYQVRVGFRVQASPRISAIDGPISCATGESASTSKP